jgi:hypothetical protein
MRVQAVKRWHMIETTRQQTLAEHQCNVALLAAMIARTAPIDFFDAFTVVAFAALVHDLPESFTGDVPSHTKKYLTGLEELEKQVSHPAFNVSCSVNSRMLLKMCDLADGIRFIRLHGVDMTATHAQEGLEDQYMERFRVAKEDLEWPAHVIEHVQHNTTFYAYEAH